MKMVIMLFYLEYDDFDLIIDAIFGFGLKGEVREPYNTILRNLSKYTNKIISIDVPSGPYLDADKSNANVNGSKNFPCNISLCVPKNCVKNFSGLHFLAGRFLPPTVKDVVLPTYTDTNEFALLNKNQ